VRAVPDEPNVALRPTADGEGQEVVMAFPYDGHLVAAVRTLPGRRFDWDR
jgi:SWI/SNF-related matrix-associated actin-dependent regulator of chromatin subfamily A-like protein 1